MSTKCLNSNVEALIDVLAQVDCGSTSAGLAEAQRYDDIMRLNVKAEVLHKLGVRALPIQVGDTVYISTPLRGYYMRRKHRPYKAKVIFIGVNDEDDFFNVELVGHSGYQLQYRFSQLGLDIHLTEEEALSALEH